MTIPSSTAQRASARKVLASILTVALAHMAGCRSGASRPVTLVFVGDMMLGRAIERAMLDREDWGFAFRPLGERLRGADLTFGNLECVVATSGPPTTFRADPRTLAALSFAGFDVVSVANNHAADGGPAALLEMLGHLRERDIAPVGVRGDEGAQAAVVLRAGRLRVGFLAYTFWTRDRDDGPGRPRIAPLEPERIARDVAAARPTVDYLVVSLHMGQSAPRSNPAQQRTARR